MKLSIKKRVGTKKSDAKKLRRESKIPAVVYSGQSENQNIVVDNAEFSALLRRMKRGHLANTVFTLEVEGEETFQAIVKDIAYHRTTYAIQHLDFVRLFDDRPISIKIPIEFLGAADCVGVKLGGVVRQVILHLPVQCLPAKIPSHFQIDVKDMQVGQSKRMKEIDFPEDVSSLVDLNEVAVVIAKR